MPWCPNCKCEYVEGKTKCPDCKCDLVDSLVEETSNFETPSLDDFSENEEEFTEILEEQVLPELQNMTKEELAMLYEEAKVRKELLQSYKPYEEQYKENKSSVGILLVVGIAGIATLLLNALNIIHLPLTGFSETLLYIVMGLLFISFVYSGIRSYIKAKKLFPLVSEEKERISTLLEFAKKAYQDGKFTIDSSVSEEENF